MDNEVYLSKMISPTRPTIVTMPYGDSVYDLELSKRTLFDA